MPITHEELQAFHQFASRKVSNGGAASISELAAIWDASRAEYNETVADVRQGLLDDAAGLGEPLSKVFADLRRELGQLQ